MRPVFFRLRAALPLSAFLFFGVVAMPALAATKSEIYAQVKAGTMLIVAIDEANNSVSIGSGFLVNPNGLVVTNAHVLEDSSRILVYARNQQVYEHPAIIVVDADRDLAALRIPATDIPALSLSGQAPTDGNDVIAVGYPRLTDVLNMGFALHPTIVPGNINGLVQGRSRTTHRVAPFVQITGHINQGSSGGPLVDVASGEVAGMVVLQVPYLERARDRKGTGIGSVMIRSGIGYAIPSSVIRQWLQENSLMEESGSATTPTRPPERLPSPEVAFATGHLIYTIAQVLPKDPDLYELAVYHYEVALSLHPRDPKFLRHLGIAYTALGRFEDAIHAMREALDQEPTCAMLAYELGLAQEAKGLNGEALDTWHSFLDRSSTNADPEGWHPKMRQAMERVKASKSASLPHP